MGHHGRARFCNHHYGARDPENSEDETVHVYGAMAGEALAMDQPNRDMMRIFGDGAGYISGDMLLIMPGTTPDVEAAELEVLTTQFADTWVDYGSELRDQAEQYRLTTMLDDMYWIGERCLTTAPTKSAMTLMCGSIRGTRRAKNS